jgi:hypothetical protein
MEGVFDFNFETLHKKVFQGLSDGVYRYYIRCKKGNGIESKQLEVSFNVNPLVAAQILLSKDPPLKEGSYEVTLISSKHLSETPSLSYSFDGISYDPLPLIGSNKVWKGYLIIDEDQGEEVGSFRFVGKDLEGQTGDEITSGNIFLVDTTEPEIVTGLKAETDFGEIDLNWYIEEEVDEFNVYRAEKPGVDITDLYKTVSKDSFTDTNVDENERYYYRVSAIDEAGNEGGLSNEVSSTGLFDDSVDEDEGLDLELRGKVDRSVNQIEDLIDQIRESYDRFDSKSESVKKIYGYLELEKSTNSVLSELNVLKREVEKYKTQTFTETELDKRLSSVDVKLGAIERRVPEDLIIGSSKTFSKSPERLSVERTFLEINLNAPGSVVKRTVDKSLEYGAENGFRTDREVYNVEVIYLSGDRSELTLIRESILGEIQDANVSIIESVPRSVASSISEISILTSGYRTLKEDLIFSFDSDVDEFVYTINKKIELDKLENILTLIIFDTGSGEKSFSITGYFTAIDSDISGYFGLVIGVLVITGLFGYLYFIKKRKGSDKVEKIREETFLGIMLLEKGEIEKAKEIYQDLSNKYKFLNKEEKSLVYDGLQEFYGKIGFS